MTRGEELGCALTAVFGSMGAGVLTLGLAEGWFSYGRWFFAALVGLLVLISQVALLSLVLEEARRRSR